MLGKSYVTRYTIVLLCLAFAYAGGLQVMKSEPARPADINSIKALYNSRSDPNHSINAVVRFVGLQDPSHLPLYHITLSLWSRYIGRDLFTLRLLSLFTGLLAIVSTYRLAREIGGRDQALDAAVILAFHAFFIFYTHQARMYALLALLSAWVLLAYWKLLQSPESSGTRWWLLLLASSAAIMYTHYVGFALLAAIGAFHVFFVPKNGRWLFVWLAMIGAGLVFLPWLPYTLSILQTRSDFTSTALTMGESLLALSSIFTNGLGLVVPLVAGLLLVRFGRLSPAQRFIIFVTIASLTLLLVANEFTPLIIARRIRYTTALAAGWFCTCAIGLNLLPRWPLLRWPAYVIWIASFFVYWNSDSLQLYTNQLNQRHSTIPHYEDLLYTASVKPEPSDFVVSVHRDTPLNEKKLLDYYGRKTGNWRGLIHISNPAGIPSVQSTDTRYADVQSMDRWKFPIWLIHNPEETELSSMAVFNGAFLSHFHSCGRFLETHDSVIDLYLSESYPCELLTSETRQRLRYDGGTEIANILLEQVAETLNVYVWWTKTLANDYAYSLQLVDAQGINVRQVDDVIGGDALSRNSISTAGLPPGVYRANFIVYDFLTRESQSGIYIDSNEPFQREVEIRRVSVAG